MSELFTRFASQLCSATESDIRQDPSLGGVLTLGSEGPLSAFYAPFDHIQSGSKVVIAGITPGLQQATNALLEARRQLLAGRSPIEALASAKVFASFSGPMRSNLVEMLDFIGVNKWCGVVSADRLWGSHSHLAHFTSALRYPVLLKGKNYSGAPSMKATPLLRSMVERHLKEEAEALRGAIWIPLGPAASQGVGCLVEGGSLDPALVLDGMPHPSPANIERIRYFTGRTPRERLSVKTNPDMIDRARAALIAKVAALPVV